MLERGTMIKNYYCPVCKKLKNRLQIKRIDDGRAWWYQCKWCHSDHIESRNYVFETMASKLIDEPKDGYRPYKN